MLHFLLFIFIIIIVIAFIFLNLISNFIRILFGGRNASYTQTGRNDNGREYSSEQRHTRNGYDYNEPSQSQTSASANKQHTKVFSKDEGEYVDFEEVEE